MAIRFRKSALKFLQKADAKDAEKIQAALRQLLAAVETQGVIPFRGCLRSVKDQLATDEKRM